MTNEGRAIMSFECSDWLAKPVELICDHPPASRPRGGRVTPANVLQEFVFEAVMKQMTVTPAGPPKLKRPPPASTRDALEFLD